MNILHFCSAPEHGGQRHASALVHQLSEAACQRSAQDLESFLDAAEVNLRGASHDGQQADAARLIVALADHAAWVGAVMRHLASNDASAPPSEQQRCRLSRWLDAAESGGRHDPRVLRHGRALHSQLHDLGDALLGLRPSMAAASLRVLGERLEATRDVLVELLAGLLGRDVALLPAR